MEAAFEGSVKNLVEDKGLKWVFVGGKGGVGKTTTSSSLAVLLSQHRKNVLIVSTDPAHNLSDAFDQKFTAKPTLVNGFTNLYGMEVDPKVDADKITLPHIAGLIEDEQATKTFLSEIVSAVPGIDEAMTFSELISSIEKENFDLVVFDTAPTGHTLRLLNFPNVMEKGLEKLVSLKQKFQGIFQQFSGLLGGNSVDMFDKVFGNMEQLKDIAVRVNAQMKDANKTTFVAVCIPEFLSMYETDRLIQELAKYSIDIHNIVINQVLFPNDECNMCIARHKMQKKYLEQILDMYEDFHITIMALQEEEVRGNEKLKNFGKLLCQPKAKPELPQKK